MLFCVLHSLSKRQQNVLAMQFWLRVFMHVPCFCTSLSGHCLWKTRSVCLPTTHANDKFVWPDISKSNDLCQKEPATDANRVNPICHISMTFWLFMTNLTCSAFTQTKGLEERPTKTKLFHTFFSDTAMINQIRWQTTHGNSCCFDNNSLLIIDTPRQESDMHGDFIIMPKKEAPCCNLLRCNVMHVQALHCSEMSAGMCLSPGQSLSKFATAWKERTGKCADSSHNFPLHLFSNANPMLLPQQQHLHFHLAVPS